MFAAVDKHIWITGHKGDLSIMNSLNFRPEKCKQHHFFKWRLGPVGWRWGKHVHSYTLSTEQPLQVTYHPPSLSGQCWRFSFSVSFCEQQFHGEPLRNLRTLMMDTLSTDGTNLASLVQDFPYPTPRGWTTTWCVCVHVWSQCCQPRAPGSL